MNPMLLQDVETGNRTKYRWSDWFLVLVFSLVGVMVVAVTGLAVVASYLFISGTAYPPAAPVIDISGIASALENLTIAASLFCYCHCHH